MDFLNALAKSASLPVKSLKELELGREYPINEVKKTFTKYGEKVRLILDNSFVVYLPNKVSKYLVENQESFDNFVKDTESRQVNFLIEFV